MPKPVNVRSVWDAGHPIWKVLQGIVAVLMVIYAGDHLTAGVGVTPHTTGVDVADGTGLVGLGVLAKLGAQFFKR